MPTFLIVPIIGTLENKSFFLFPARFKTLNRFLLFDQNTAKRNSIIFNSKDFKYKKSTMGFWGFRSFRSF